MVQLGVPWDPKPEVIDAVISFFFSFSFSFSFSYMMPFNLLRKCGSDDETTNKFIFFWCGVSGVCVSVRVVIFFYNKEKDLAVTDHVWQTDQLKKEKVCAVISNCLFRKTNQKAS